MPERTTSSTTTSLMVVGILLIIFGIVAIATPAIAGTAVVLVIGSVMLIAGIAQTISAFRVESGSSRWVPLVLGIITAAAGLVVLGHPLLGLSFLTLLLTVYFIVEGVWKIFASLSYRPASGWIALLISGILTLLLGGLIWAQWPVSGLWAVGVLVGVNLLFTGLSLVLLATTIKQMRKGVERRSQGGPSQDVPSGA